MSPQEFIEKIQLFIALWRKRRYDQLACSVAVGCGIAFTWVRADKTAFPFLDPHRNLVLVVLACLCAACVLFVAIHVARLQDPNRTQGMEPPLPSSVRGPLPFTEADGDLFRSLGREGLVGEILVSVNNDQIPVVIVSGESGVGKTSLLRAGLTAPLKQASGRTVIYWEARPSDALASLTATILNCVGESSGIASLDDLFLKRPLAARPAIFIDQLEQLTPTNPAHAPIYELIVRAATKPAPHPATWIIAFRRDFVGIYEFLFSRGQTPPAVLVPAFSQEQAEEVMATLADRAGVRLERQLLADFTTSAAVNGAVSSVDIGIGTLVLVNLAKRAGKEILTLNDYKFAGGSSRVLAVYIKDQLAKYPASWQDAVLQALLALIDHATNQRLAEGRSAASLAAGSTLPAGRLGMILDSLAAPHIRILEKLEGRVGEEAPYRLPHERFIPAIQTLAGTLLASENRAQFVLDTSLSAWIRSRDTKYLLSGKDLRQVRELVTLRAATMTPEALDYVRRSRRLERTKLAKLTAVCVLAVCVLARLIVKVEWLPTTMPGDIPTGSEYNTKINGFPGAVVITGYSTDADGDRVGDVPGVYIWRAIDGHFVKKINGTVRASCEAKGVLLIEEGQGEKRSILDLSNFRSQALPLSSFSTKPDFDESCGYLVSEIPSAGARGSNALRFEIWDTGKGRLVPAANCCSFPWEPLQETELVLGKDLSKSGLLVRFKQQGKTQLALWDIEKNEAKRILTQYQGERDHAVDRSHEIVAVLENVDNNQEAVELWDLYSGELKGERRIPRRRSPDLDHGIEFVANSSLLKVEDDRWNVSLLNSKDLSNSSFPEGNSGLGKVGFGFHLVQSGSDALELGSSGEGPLLLHNTEIPKIADISIDKKYAAAVLIYEGDHYLQTCDPHRSPSCTPAISGVSEIKHVLGDKVVGVIMERDHSISVFDYKGEEKAAGLGGDWGNVRELSYNSECGDVYAWQQQGAVVRYRPTLTILGHPVVKRHPGCPD